MNFEELLRRAGVWRGREVAPASGVATGYPALDGTLPGGGWPRTGLTELLCEAPGIGALSLVLPALAALSREARWIVWVAPPYIPYSPALDACGMDLSRVLIVDLPEERGRGHEHLWAGEQALRFPDCGAALLWLEGVGDLHLRRLQLAAEAGRTWGVVFRSRRHARTPSPAPLRLALEPGDDRLAVQVLKARGGRQGLRCTLEI